MHEFVTFAIATYAALCALVIIGSVGKPRGRITPGLAVYAVTVNAAIVVGVLYIGGVL